MNTSTQPEARSSWDGLTRSERSRLYDPAAYVVRKFGTGHFFIDHAEVAARFTLMAVSKNGRALVTSNTNGQQWIDLRAQSCSCEDFKCRAQQEQRPCKHLAVAQAVAAFLVGPRLT